MIDGFGNVDDIGDCSGLILDGCFLLLGLVGVHQIEVIGKGCETSPEEEPVDEPPGGVAVLL
jgi:hypothetical protein